MMINSRIRLLLIAGIVALSCGVAYAQGVFEGGFDTNAGPQAASMAGPSTVTQAVAPKPAQFPSWAARGDYIHENLPRMLQSYVQTADTLLAGTNEVVATPPSRFRLTSYVEFSYEDGFQFNLSPNFEAEIALPNLESRWNIFIDGERNDQLPGIDPTERKKGAQAGVRKALENVAVQFEVGANIAIPPTAYAQVEWNPEWIWRHWALYPNARAYFETDEGFGSIAGFSLHRWFRGDRPRNLILFRPAVKWTEETQGVEWLQTFGYGYVSEMIENKWHWKRTVSGDDVARGFGIQFTTLGHSSGETVMDSRRIRVTYRRPLYKQWIYLEITPGVEWNRERNWNTDPSLRFGFDMLFWGTPER